jgi:hypothetical protein
MYKQVLEDFCGGLLIFSQLLKIFGATNLGKGSYCLDTNEWLFIMDTPQ